MRWLVDLFRIPDDDHARRELLRLSRLERSINALADRRKRRYLLELIRLGRVTAPPDAEP